MVKARDFTYASPDDGLLKKAVIRSIENMTGRRRLYRLYRDYPQRVPATYSFWRAAIHQLQLKLRYDAAALQAVPATGPVVIVANHPFGVVDGIVISFLISQVRSDFKVLTNSLLYRAPEAQPFLLPIDFSETKAALKTNLKSRSEARGILSRGGCIVAFPGGTVSTAPRAFGRAKDPDWKPFTARLIQDAKATVVPIYFAGQNSRLFQIASQFSQTLRLSLLFKEVINKMDREMPIEIGTPIPFDELAHLTNRHLLCAALRERTYQLAKQIAYAA